MIMNNVGSPWSEAEPGTKFEDWWAQQFRDKAPNLEMGNPDQQLDWVTGTSNRAGVNGLMKPLKGVVGGSAVEAQRPAAFRWQLGEGGAAASAHQQL